MGSTEKTDHNTGEKTVMKGVFPKTFVTLVKMNDDPIVVQTKKAIVAMISSARDRWLESKEYDTR